MGYDAEAETVDKQSGWRCIRLDSTYCWNRPSVLSA